MHAPVAPQAGATLPIPSHVSSFMPLYQPPCVCYLRGSQWMVMPPDSNLLLLHCANTVERLATLLFAVLKGWKCGIFLALEQEELLVQLLAAQDATGAPSPNMPIVAPPTKVAKELEDVP
ncbi:hypothetical protein C0989_003999, partial [Termitomyces sp. Mn162]